MNKKISVTLLAAGLLAGGCIFAPVEKASSGDELLSIRFGTSFGECLGYCVNTLMIDEQNMTLSREGWVQGGSLPGLRFEAGPDSKRWSMLRTAWSANAESFSELDSIIGCPDCADGGAEWIEVRTASGRKKVTYEYATDLQGIGELQRSLRGLMAQMQAQVEGTPGSLQFSDDAPGSILLDPIVLRAGRVQNDSLILDVAYGGGCKQHQFDLVMAPAAFLESYPVQANLYLRHDARGDLCKALIHETITFDLSALKHRYVQAYGTTGSTASESIILNIHTPKSDGLLARLQLTYVLYFEG